MNVHLSGSPFDSFLAFGLASIPALSLAGVLGSALRRSFFAGECLLIGLTGGFLLQTALSFVASLIFGFRIATLAACWLAITVVSWGRIWQQHRASIGRLVAFLGHPRAVTLRLSKVDVWGSAVFFAAFFLFALLLQRKILWPEGALATGYLDDWGDLPVHISLIMSFLSDTTLHLRSTILAGQPLTYPFMADFFSALLMRAGMSLEYAIEWPGVLFNAITATLLFYLGYRMIRNKAAAALVPLLFILAGGLGFLWFFRDIYLSDRPIWELLQHLPQRYTKLEAANIHWVNPTLAHLIPQRSLLFGFPAGLSVILLWWHGFRKRNAAPYLAGLLYGLLPLAHTHTFLALAMAGGMLFLFEMLMRVHRRARLHYWLKFGATAAIVAVPQLIYLLSSKLSLQTIRFHPGWMAETDGPIWFWLKNLGVFIPMLLVALLLRRKLRLRSRALRFYLPFGLLFVIGNLFLFAAFAYDNNKVLVYWFLLSLPFVSLLLVRIWQSHNWWLHAALFRTLLLALVLSGALNLLHEFQNNGWIELSREEVELAAQVEEITKSTAIFLSAPIHNNLLTLAGRAVVLGYPGHVLSHGLPYQALEQQVQAIYSGDPRAKALLRQLAIDYVVVGPQEASRYGVEKVAWFTGIFPLLLQSENYRIYKVRDLAISATPNNTSAQRDASEAK